MNYQVIDILHKDKWIKYVKNAKNFDFYHSWYYHKLVTEGDPLLFLYEEEAAYIAIPFIKRQVNGTDAYDLTSVYGYAGPLSNHAFIALPPDFIQRFKNAFLDFLYEYNILSVFSRLHPLIDHLHLVKSIGGLHNNGKTVMIDLNRPPDVQQKNYRKSVLCAIKTLRSRSPVTRQIDGQEDFSLFCSIYYENMRRVNASPDYFFPESYFTGLLASREFDCRIMLVFLDGEAIAGGVFMHTDRIIEVHLLATRNNYLHLSPTKLLIDEVANRGREEGMRCVHLGGGVGGSQDSLFFWKSGFSDVYLDFYTWRYIANKDRYDDLSRQVRVNESAKSPDHFPLYRA